MKKTATSVLMLLTAISQAGAEVTGSNAVNPYPHYTPQQSPINITSNTRVNLKTRYMFNGSGFVPVGKVEYSYNPGMGSNIDIYDTNDDQVFFSSSITYSYAGGNYQNWYKREQHYTSTMDINDLHYYRWTSNVWKDSVYYSYQYNGFGIEQVLLHIFSGAGWGNQLSYNNGYNASGNLVSMDEMGYHMYYDYDASNRISVQWDANGPLSNLQNSEKDSLVYDAGGRLSEKYLYNWNAGTLKWDKSEWWQYSYITGSDNLAMIRKQKWQSVGGFVNNYMQLFAYDASNNRITDLTQRWNNATSSYENQNKLEWTYNMDKQPLTLTSSTWINNSWGNSATDYRVTWSYEKYFPNAIKDAGSNVAMSLYPNPVSSNAINVSLSWRQVQPFALSVLDMQGRLVFNREENATREYAAQVPVSQLSNGNYFLVVKGKDATATQQFTVAR